MAESFMGTSYSVESLGRGRFLVCGSFRPQGASALVDADTAPGLLHPRGFTVVRTGVGLYTVTFSHLWHDMVACFVGVREAGGVRVSGQGGDWSAANRTLQIRTFNAADALADLADDVDNRISFMAVMLFSGVDGNVAT